MIGISGSFAINGSELLMQPTEAGWVDRELLGVSGEARPIYPAVRQFELTWNYMSMSEFSQLVSAYNTSQSGTIAVDLPKYGVSPYQFWSYSGCTLREPTAGKFFVENVSNVSLLILNIDTL